MWEVGGRCEGERAEGGGGGGGGREREQREACVRAKQRCEMPPAKSYGVGWKRRTGAEEKEDKSKSRSCTSLPSGLSPTIFWRQKGQRVGRAGSVRLLFFFSFWDSGLVVMRGETIESSSTQRKNNKKREEPSSCVVVTHHLPFLPLFLPHFSLKTTTFRRRRSGAEELRSRPSLRRRRRRWRRRAPCSVAACARACTSTCTPTGPRRSAAPTPAPRRTAPAGPAPAFARAHRSSVPARCAGDPWRARQPPGWRSRHAPCTSRTGRTRTTRCRSAGRAPSRAPAPAPCTTAARQDPGRPCR
eukprot:Rhum_TRINITY_DN14159_c17_g1::Rhum_TRINITY_DN14159_c17_g1_i1::g.71240::m.71240